LNQNIKPQGEVGVTGIHEMTTEDLVDAPTFNQVAEQATVVLDRRHVLVFNAAFDRRVLKQTYGRYGLKLPTGCRWTCMQDLFSIYLSD
jgi:DNA polymerase-3 subunit epsilon